jgi:hypothetical protein
LLFLVLHTKVRKKKTKVKITSLAVAATNKCRLTTKNRKKKQIATFESGYL